MITVTTEVRVLDENGSHLVVSVTDVASESTAVPITMYRVAGQVTLALEEQESL